MKGGYILINGTFQRENEFVFSCIDLQRLGKSMKESFRTENNVILFPEDNYTHLINGLSAVGFKRPKDWDLLRLKHDVSRLLNKNHLFLAARVDIFFISGIDGTDYVLTAEEIPRGYYPLNEQGLMIGLYNDGVKSDTGLNSFEAASRFLWITASEQAIADSKHNLIIFNNKGHACEGISASFGYLKNQTAVFPSKYSMGYQPPLMNTIIKCAKQCGLTVLLKADITREDLLNADELFLIDNCLGIQKILGLGDRRYYNIKTAVLASKLNEIAHKGGSHSQSS